MYSILLIHLVHTAIYLTLFKPWNQSYHTISIVWIMLVRQLNVSFLPVLNRRGNKKLKGWNNDFEERDLPPSSPAHSYFFHISLTGLWSLTSRYPETEVEEAVN